jgi:PEP-CTERM motif
MKSLYRLGIAVIALSLAGVHAKADQLLFDFAGDGETSSSSATGFDQGVTVGTTTQLTGIAFDIASILGANVKYVIFDGTDSTLLYQSTPFALAASPTVSWVEAPVTFTLQAGTKYYIGYISDGKAFSSFAAGPFSENGIVAEDNNNGSALFYPTPRGGGSNHGTRDFALELFGTQAAVSAAPEPASIALLGTGLLGLAGVIRRRRLS